MATRAVIATQTYDRGILATYLHFDGYPEHVLPILVDRYLDPDDAIDDDIITEFNTRLAECETYAKHLRNWGHQSSLGPKAG